MSYLRKMGHTCQRGDDTKRKYAIINCKACVEKSNVKKQMDEFNDMMKTTIEWDDYCVFV